MTFREYSKKASKTATFDTDNLESILSYLTLGLNGEAGEVAEKIKKILRDRDPGQTMEQLSVRNYAIASELGDVLWYLSQLSRYCGFTLDEIAELNIEKLEDRAFRGTIQGSGDNR